MATYTFLGGDSFDDPNNWYNVTAGKPDDGVPGPNDTIGGATPVIPAAGETVANAEGSTSKPVEIQGNLTITGEGSDLWLLFGGNFSIGAIDGGYIVMSNGTTVTAGSVDLSEPNSIGLSLDGTSSLTVTGSVVAQGDDIDTSGTFDVDGGVSVTNATMEINGGLATVGGALTLDSGSYLDLYKGSATVGSLSVVGSTAQVGLVQVGSSTVATLKVTGDATVGSGGLSVLAGSTLTVGGNLVIGSGSLTVDENATFDLRGSLIVGDHHATASPADVASSPAIRVLPPTFTLDTGSQPVTLYEDCIIGYNTKGTATIKSTLDANHWDVTLGQNKTGNGQLTVDGGGAKLDNIASLLVGVDGKGTALIENGGQMFASTLWDGSSSSSHQGTGEITVSGGGSGLGVAHKAYVGEHASGSLTVQKDGGVAIGSYLGVGAKGRMTVLSNAEIRVGTVVSAPTPGSVTIGAGGAVWLSCAGGAYNANTVISGGGLHIEQTGAIAEKSGISFKGAGTFDSLQ